MKYFKNSDLTKHYDVSDKAVRNWIQAAQEGRNNLELFIDRDTTFIADTISNVEIIKELAEKGRKYRNHRTYKSVEPLPSFYETFSSRHIYEIINRLELDNDLPGHYKYFGAGAIFWNKYLFKLKESGSSNILSNTIETLELNLAYITKLIDGYKYVNVINLCVGNSLTIEPLIRHLDSIGRLNQIKLIDISPDMLQISENNIKLWVGQKYKIKHYLRDLSYERFDDILMEESYGTDASETINLLLFVAGPIANFSRPSQALYTISSSMRKQDIMLTTLKRNTLETQNFFDFGIKGEGVLMSRHDGFLLQQLNIKPEFYEIEQFYEPTAKMRSMQIRLKVDLTLNFKLRNYKKSVDFRKGDYIRVWKAWHHNDEDIINRFSDTGFNVISTSRSIDEQLNLLIAKVRPIV